MKKLILITALFFVSIPALAQVSEYTQPNTNLAPMYATGSFSENPWGEPINWEVTKRLSFTDIITPGWIDTAQTTLVTLPVTGRRAYFYGKPIPLKQCDSLARTWLAGYDSAEVWIHYRWVSRTANVWSAGAWNVYDSAGVVFTNNVAVGSASTDSLVTSVLGFNIDWDDSPPYIQFRYTIISKIALVGDGSRRTMRKPTGNNQPFWRGEAIVTLDRGNR